MTGLDSLNVRVTSKNYGHGRENVLILLYLPFVFFFCSCAERIVIYTNSSRFNILAEDGFINALIPQSSLQIHTQLVLLFMLCVHPA